MTSDSLIRTYSVSSTLAILNKNNSRLSSINVENEILQMDLDSLNNNYYSERTKSTIKLLNSAKNINTNQQRSDDEETENSLHSRSRRVRVSFKKPHCSRIRISFSLELVVLLSNICRHHLCLSYKYYLLCVLSIEF